MPKAARSEVREDLRASVKVEGRAAEKAWRCKIAMPGQRSAESRLGREKVDEERSLDSVMRCPESRAVLG
jgi:hypothetical protein